MRLRLDTLAVETRPNQQLQRRKLELDLRIWATAVCAVILATSPTICALYIYCSVATIVLLVLLVLFVPLLEDVAQYSNKVYWLCSASPPANDEPKAGAN
jgi:hypothetical protein